MSGQKHCKQTDLFIFFRAFQTPKSGMNGVLLRFVLVTALSDGG